MTFEYSPKQFWEQRGQLYPFEIQGFSFFDFPFKSEFESKIAELKPKSILDAGCGAGRLFPLYKGVERVLAVDFSTSMLKYASMVKLTLGLSNVEIRNFDIRDAAFIGESFDLILTRQVLMHIKPEDIKKTVDGLIGICKKNILIHEYFGASPTLAPHNFRHDYPTLFSKLKAVEQKDVDGGIFMLLEKEA